MKEELSKNKVHISKYERQNMNRINIMYKDMLNS